MGAVLRHEAVRVCGVDIEDPVSGPDIGLRKLSESFPPTLRTLLPCMICYPARCKGNAPV